MEGDFLEGGDSSRASAADPQNEAAGRGTN
jgi:hypothetical protein